MSIDTSPTAIDAYVPIESVVVVGRHRKHLGDIDALAASIDDIGLLNPITITPTNRLVAGERRLEALRRLGRTEVPVRIVASLDEAARLLTAERDENTCRLDHSPSELVSLGRALEAVERPAAEARRRAGAQYRDLGVGGPQGLVEPGKTYEKVGKALGWSGAGYKRGKKVVDIAADPDQPPDVRKVAADALDEMDRTGKVTPAYDKVMDALGRDRARRDAQEAKAATLAVDPEPEEPAQPPTRGAERRARIAELAAEGWSSRQIAADVGVRDDAVRKIAREMGVHISADDVMARTRKIDSNRVVRETVFALEGSAMGVQLVNVNALDPAECDGWVSSMTDSLRVLNRFVKQLKEKTREA